MVTLPHGNNDGLNANVSEVGPEKKCQLRDNSKQQECVSNRKFMSNHDFQFGRHLRKTALGIGWDPRALSLPVSPAHVPGQKENCTGKMSATGGCVCFIFFFFSFTAAVLFTPRHVRKMLHCELLHCVAVILRCTGLWRDNLIRL